MIPTPLTGAKWTSDKIVTTITWSFATLPGDLVTFASPITATAFRDATRAAFSVWEKLAAIDFVEIADTLESNIRLGWSNIDLRGNTLATATWRYASTTLVEAEIEFDRDEAWRPTSATATSPNFYATAVHEIGHAIGLGHADDRTSIMYPYQTNVTTPSVADIQAVQSLYGVPDNPAANAVYRFFNQDNGVHFYTASIAERDAVKAALPQYQYEGPAFALPDQALTDVDVFRFYNADTNAHFYTASAAERDYVQRTLPDFQYEGPAFEAFSDAGANGEHHAVYRFYRPDTGTHFYTASADEKAHVENTFPTYHYEGVAYFV